MVIAHIHTNKGWGGGENQVLALLTGMTTRGVRTVLYAGRRGVLFERAKAKGFMVRPFTVSVSPWLASISGRMIAREMADERVSLVHVHDSAALDIGVVASRQVGVPLVLSRRIASPLRMNPWSRRKYSTNNIAMVIAVSNTVRDVMVACGFPGGRIKVVPDGVDIAGLSEIVPNVTFRGANPSSFWIGGLGRLTWKKNWPFLIRTAAKVAADGLDVCWIIVGDGPDMKELKNLAEELGVADRVFFAGFRSDAAAILKGLDALFFPSRMEGASVTVREAMAMGVPVIAADAPGVVESLGGHGWLVPCDDVAAAAAAVRDLVGNPVKRVQVAEAARLSAIERFPISATVEGTLAAYRELLDEGA